MFQHHNSPVLYQSGYAMYKCSWDMRAASNNVNF